MRYRDEEILRKREELRRRNYASLEKGYYMDGEILTFERKRLLDTCSLMLPDSMKLMPEELARIKYPSEFRPQRILTSMDLDVNLGFSLLKFDVEAGKTAGLAERMQAAICRSNPDYKMDRLMLLEGADGGWFSFRSHAMDSDIYNMMLIMNIGGVPVHSCFNCGYEREEKWKLRGENRLSERYSAGWRDRSCVMNMS